MADLLVRLYALPPVGTLEDGLGAQGITVRRAVASERGVVVGFAREHGSEGWADECAAAFARSPVACFVAVEAGAGGGDPGRGPAAETLVGFAAYDAACRNFFGPELVRADRRGRGIGRALLLAALRAMRADGYGYAIIGWASSIDFYRRAVGATVIEGSTPGIYPPPLVR